MGYFWGLLIGYVINGLIWGFVTQHVAESKGYSSGFAWGFWLGLIGLLVVGFRPNIQEDSYSSVNSEYWSNIRRYDVRDKETWQCKCGAKNPYSVNYCLSCRRNKNEALTKTKKCPHCGANNNESNETCFACGKSMKEESGPIPVKQEIIKAVPNASPSFATLQGEVQNKAELIDMLGKLSELHKQGVLTDDEFQQKKADILSKF